MDSLDTFLDALADRLAAKVNAKPAAVEDGDPLLNARDAAKRLKMGTKKLYALVEDGQIKRAKGYSVVRIRRSVLDAYGK